jgi:hypothetical protein
MKIKYKIFISIDYLEVLRYNVSTYIRNGLRYIKQSQMHRIRRNFISIAHQHIKYIRQN